MYSVEQTITEQFPPSFDTTHNDEFTTNNDLHVLFCLSVGDRGEGSFLAGSGANVFIPLFNSTARTKKDCLDMIVGMIYKDGWDDEGKPKWSAMTFFEPLYQTITKAKEMYCSQVVINNVPCLEKCRPRLFASVRGVCAALSSEALPKMKKFWKRAQEESLNIDEFTQVLFFQLYETHPRIINELEAGYVYVCMGVCMVFLIYVPFACTYLLTSFLYTSYPVLSTHTLTLSSQPSHLSFPPPLSSHLLSSHLTPSYPPPPLSQLCRGDDSRDVYANRLQRRRRVGLERVHHVSFPYRYVSPPPTYLMSSSSLPPSPLILPPPPNPLILTP